MLFFSERVQGHDFFRVHRGCHGFARRFDWCVGARRLRVVHRSGTGRAALNWEKHFDLAFDTDTARAFHDEDLDVDTDFCAMCGHDWCSVRISKEIVEFASGKDPRYAWETAKQSGALTREQQEILEKRGVLSPAEIHELAGKCHSDTVADSDEAQRLQDEVLA